MAYGIKEIKGNNECITLKWKCMWILCGNINTSSLQE